MATGVQGHFLGVKRLERKIDLSFPSNAKVKDNWSYTSLTLYDFMVWAERTSHLP